MHESPIKKELLLILTFLSLLIVLIITLHSLLNRQTIIVFCDVGQGDGIYIRIHNRVDVIIDAGPDKRMLDCLGKYMPFYDHTVEYVFITNNDHDHYNGLNYILPRYKINSVYLTPLDKSTQSFSLLKKQLAMEKATLLFPFADQQLTIDQTLFTFYWPTKNFTEDNIYQTAHPQSNILFGNSSHGPNDFSLVFLFEENQFDVLFTGDASPFVLNNLLQSKDFIQSFKYHIADKNGLDILKVPHHGSRNGLIQAFLSLADPSLSVISVGKKNKFGHPSKEILDMLKASDKNYLRTDEKGSVIIKVPSNNNRNTK